MGLAGILRDELKEQPATAAQIMELQAAMSNIRFRDVHLQSVTPTVSHDFI